MPAIKVVPRRKTHNLLPLMLPVLLAALALFWAFSRDAGPSAPDQALPVAPIAHQGQIWVPRGDVVLLPDRQMREIGRTSENVALYAAPLPVGGGGGLAEPAAGRQPVYIRVAEDQYRRVTLIRLN